MKKLHFGPRVGWSDGHSGSHAATGLVRQQEEFHQGEVDVIQQVDRVPRSSQCGAEGLGVAEENVQFGRASATVRRRWCICVWYCKGMDEELRTSGVKGARRSCFPNVCSVAKMKSAWGTKSASKSIGWHSGNGLGSAWSGLFSGCCAVGRVTLVMVLAWASGTVVVFLSLSLDQTRLVFFFIWSQWANGDWRSKWGGWVRTSSKLSPNASRACNCVVTEKPYVRKRR